MRRAGFAVILVLLLSGGCAALREKGREAPVLLAELRADEPDFSLAEQRETKLLFSVRNISRRQLQLHFPSSQHLEVTLRGPDGRQLFLWSEDRRFESQPGLVTVNPGERLEYEASVPTRDMLAGRTYRAEAVLPGHHDTLAMTELRPR